MSARTDIRYFRDARHISKGARSPDIHIGNQFKLEVGNENFYVDILLYHRRLKALVALELKAGAFRPEYAGKMSFYLTVLNEKIRTEDPGRAGEIVQIMEPDQRMQMKDL